MTDSRERADVLSALQKHRGFLRHTLEGVSDEQARTRTTVSELCLGGIVKHVSRVEQRWAGFMERGAEAMGSGFDEGSLRAHLESFQMLEGESAKGLLGAYEAAAAHTAVVVHRLASLDISHPLPEAPWFERTEWSARRVLLHILAETAQHAGHADIIREALDGSKTMG